ncbi:MAG: DNA-binding transcriptional ArsR family regulator [Myxococcota bacterium]|jgi:DNA-binding transcriptional ArsR family regulator
MMSSAATEDRLNAVFNALANPTRRKQLARLKIGPATVGELAAPFAMSLPAASKHLRVLENAGLVTRTIEGRVHRCSLAAAPMAEASEWLAHYRTFWDDQLDALVEYLEQPQPEQDNG